MTVQIQPGVRVTVIPTKKYKTIRIFLRFSAAHQKDQAGKRTFLTSLLETNSLHYPTQTVLSEKLADLYGASFGMDVSKKGNIHQVNVMLSLVNGKYVGDATIFNKGVAFLQEVLFQPNIKNGLFDAETFALEKANTLAYLKSIEEDKQALASLAVQSLYFESESDQRVPSFGRISDVAQAENAELVATYEDLLQHDQVDIFVVGDIAAETVVAAFQSWPFPKTERPKPAMFYHQDIRPTVAKASRQETVLQAKLNLAYQTGIYFDEVQKPALMVFNGLFGGYPHSKLFLNVREKASLAYYAATSFDSFRGLLTVQTGIDGKNRDQVLALIDEQLKKMCVGAFTESELAQTKVMLKNDYLLSLDSAQALIERAYLDQWLPQTKETVDQFLLRLERVTKEEVQEVANKMKLQAIFILAKEELG